ncbi:MAG TPA: cupredoxin domain-containing protein [Streptosporangiaceae bacterium]|jgi:plastocyanin
MRIHRCLAAGAAVAAIALAGCASAASATGSGSAPASPAASGAAQRVTIQGTNTLRFTPMTVHVRTGTVRITLADMGTYPHNIVIPGLHITSQTVTGDPGSGNVTFTVKFPHAGRYAFHCQYHQSAGMVGVFVVA